jgi:hypothetical protein
MKFKINENGVLSILRAGQWVNQQCPFDAYQATGMANCTHNCPHFGEPEVVTLGPTPHRGWQLHLCHGTVLFGELIDQRGEPTRS